MMSGRLRRRGFTLLEVLLTLVILSLISMTVWTTFSNSFRMRDKLDEQESAVHALRSLLAKLNRDISMSFVVKEKRYHTLFIGKDEGVQDELSFSTFSNWTYDEESKASSQMIVSYYTQPNRDDGSLLDIYRWSYPYIEDDQYWGDKRGIKLFERVKRFDLSYYDGTEYRPAWDTEKSENVGKLPEAVKLTLELANQTTYEDLFPIQLPVALASREIKVAAPNPANPPPPGGAGKPNPPTTPPPTGGPPDE